MPQRALILNSEVELGRRRLDGWRRKERRFWWAEGLFAGDGPCPDAVRRLDRISGVSEQDRVCEEGDGVYADPASVSEFDPAGANLRRVLNFGGGLSTAIRANQMAAWGRGLAWSTRDRFPSDDTIRNLFLRFGMGEVQRFFEPLTEWMMERVPRVEGSGRKLCGGGM